MSAEYPVLLDLSGRRCVVLGGGELGRDKVLGLVEASAAVTVVAAEIAPELIELAGSGTIVWIRRPPTSEDLEGAWLAIDASGDENLNRACWEAAERDGIILNVVDRPERCHFTAPAIVHRGPLRIAISTQGESPFLASALRVRLERMIGEEWGPFVALVGALRRRLREQGVTIPEQKRIYRRILNSGVRRLLRDGAGDAAAREADRLASEVRRGAPGRVTLVGAGPGDPELLTVRGSDLLAGADIVFHDALIEPGLLAFCGPDTEVVHVGKRAGRRNPDQQGITDRMIEAASSGLEVVRLKGGDPFIFGRGGEEMAGLIAAGIDVTVLPGVSSAAAAPLIAGIPLTMRGVSASVAFITGRLRDDDGADRPDLEKVAAAVDTLVVLMPLGTIEQLAERLGQAVGGDRPAALIAHATSADQRVVRATLGTIAAAAGEAGISAPATLVVGHVVNAIPAAGDHSGVDDQP